MSPSLINRCLHRSQLEPIGETAQWNYHSQSLGRIFGAGNVDELLHCYQLRLTP